MTKRKIHLALVVVSIFFTLVWGALTAPGAAGGKMTIKRIDDPVTVEGAQAKDLCGKPITKMRLLTWKNGKFVPTPYQIDERHPSGDWVFPIADPPERDNDGGMLDDNDELVFMARDAGDEAPAGAKPAGAGAGVKIIVEDPVDGGVGYAYLFLFGTPPAPSNKDYASHKVTKDWMWMIGSTYKIGTGIHESYFDKCMLKRPDGSWSPDITDRYKTRGKGIPGMGETPESKAKTKTVGWVDGPVRVIRKTLGWLVVAMAIKIHGEGSSQNLYYPSFFVVPLKLQIPKVPKALIRNLNMTQTVDFTRKFWGVKYFDPVNTGGVRLDGKMSAAEKKLDLDKSRSWYCLTGPPGTVFVRYTYPKIMRDNIITAGYYMDDANAADPPEEEPGQSNVGIWMKGLGKMKAGTYNYEGYFYFPQNFTWAKRRRILDMLDHPLEVTVKKIQ